MLSQFQVATVITIAMMTMIRAGEMEMKIMKNLVLGLMLGSSLTGLGMQFNDYASSHGLDASRVLGDLQANHAQDLQNLPVVEMILGDRFSVPSINLLAMNFSDKQTLLQQQLQNLGTGNAFTALLGTDDQKAIAGLNPEQTVLAQNLLMVLESKLADLLIKSPTPLVMPPASPGHGPSPVSPDHGGLAGVVPPALSPIEIPAAVAANSIVKSAAASLKDKEDSLRDAQDMLASLQTEGTNDAKIRQAKSRVEMAKQAVVKAIRLLLQEITNAQKPAATIAVTGSPVVGGENVAPASATGRPGAPAGLLAQIQAAKDKLDMKHVAGEPTSAFNRDKARIAAAKKQVAKQKMDGLSRLLGSNFDEEELADLEQLIKEYKQAYQESYEPAAMTTHRQKFEENKQAKAREREVKELRRQIAIEQGKQRELQEVIVSKQKELDLVDTNYAGKDQEFRDSKKKPLAAVIANRNKQLDESVARVQAFNGRIAQLSGVVAASVPAPIAAAAPAPAPAPAAITSQPAMASITPAVASVPVAAPVVPAPASAQSGSTSVMAVPVPAPAPAYVPVLNPTVSQGGYIPTDSVFPSVTLTPVGQAQMQELAIDQALIDQVENYNALKVQALLWRLDRDNLTDDQLRELYLIKRRLDRAYTGNKLSGFVSSRLDPWSSKIDEWVARQHAQKAE